ncbi:F0F1 ATP synthase subunit epsilon [Demequina aurantiaca]|uniref:F0F1 ATP synthase subunit epsilon n=1 Tax=Demequina aurantiaca TaxID=676200 RepID=UPI003D329C32
MADALTVDIVGPDSVLWSGTAKSVTVPTVEGEIGLLSGHVPVLSVLRHGSVRVHASQGDPRSLDIIGGFVSFDHDVVTIVADLADESDEK